MSQPAISVANLSKKYAVGSRERGHGTLYDLLAAQLRAPFRRRHAAAGVDTQGQVFWALREINFQVQPGEVVGMVGPNGAGKSTLLKVLSRITAPTTGRIAVRGRLASLLEVGTGFHPELSGRENIYLNGAILGMAQREIARKFDEIVGFAEIDTFVDTPVKRYSSGMYVRLAFAVAAHLETDVLLVDEVLAVGDASFQRKSLGKMSEVAKGGRTVLFVSHNLGAVRNLCSRSLLLQNGALSFNGPTAEALSIYESRFGDAGGKLSVAHFDGPLSDQIVFHEVLCSQDGNPVSILDPLQAFTVEVRGVARRSLPALDLCISLHRDGFHVASCFDSLQAAGLREGAFVSRFELPGGVLRFGRYTVGVGASTSSEWVLGRDVAVLDFSENLGGRSTHRVTGAVELPYSSERLQ